MAAVNVLNVKYLNPNPSSATSPLEFEITMECVSQLEAREVEWTMTYVGSAQDNKYDQLLDSVEVETIVATMKFVFEARAANLFLVPKEDQLDNSAVILSAKYKGREFCRVGYYMRHEYPADFVNSLRTCNDASASLVEPELPCGDKLNLQVLQRLVDVENPRVTHYLIDWDAPNEQLVPPPAASEELPDDEDIIGDDDEEDDDEEEVDKDATDDVDADVEMEIGEGGPKAQGTCNENVNISMTHE